jgi:hypothetical protein
MTKTSTKKYTKKNINNLRIEEIPIHLAKVILYPKDGKPKILEFVDLEPEEEEPQVFYGRNKKRHEILRVRTKYGDELRFVWYEGNDYINVFADAGIHKARYMITLNQLTQFLNSTIVLYSTMLKLHKKFRKIEPMKIHKQRIKKIKRLIRKYKMK